MCLNGQSSGLSPGIYKGMCSIRVWWQSDNVRNDRTPCLQSMLWFRAGAESLSCDLLSLYTACRPPPSTRHLTTNNCLKHSMLQHHKSRLTLKWRLIHGINKYRRPILRMHFRSFFSCRKALLFSLWMCIFLFTSRVLFSVKSGQSIGRFIVLLNIKNISNQSLKGSDFQLTHHSLLPFKFDENKGASHLWTACCEYHLLEKHCV